MSFGDDVAPLFGSVRIFHADLAEAARHALEVRLESKRPARVHRHHFIHAVRIQEAAIERRDARLFDRDELAVQIAERIRRGHRLLQNQSFTLSTMRVHSPPSSTVFSG